MPTSASTIAGEHDLLFWFITALTVLFTTIVAIGLVYNAIKYRRRSPDEIPVQIEGSLRLELTWTLIPLVLALITFAWGALVYIRMSRIPEDGMQVYVVGRQWMWKAQQPTGQWENNELHVPVGRPVTLTMTSQDVIHDFWVPEFRVKQDVLPGRYSQLSFTATKPGTYNIFCSEYCGKDHSRMIGKVYAQSEAEYQTWLAGGITGETPAAAGLRLFNGLGCANCHAEDPQARAPNLAGLYGRTEQLEGGQTVTVDDTYIRESILNPQAKIVASYNPIMPTFAGQLSEEQILNLIAYIQSLSNTETGPGGQGGSNAGGQGGNDMGGGAVSQPTAPANQEP